MDEHSTHLVDRAEAQALSVEILHLQTNAETSNGNDRFDYTYSVGCKGVGCRHHVSGTHTSKGWIAAKKQRHGEILEALGTCAPVHADRRHYSRVILNYCNLPPQTGRLR